MRVLIINGADVNALNDDAIKSAAHNGHEDVVELLILNGANVEAENDYALKTAIYNKHAKVKEVLCKMWYKRQ